tara:strand:+ start:261 stop:611 length:351 start_codon:yes stop_codon:yes gene_type:complete
MGYYIIYPMFNNQTNEVKMSNSKKEIWLVIEKYGYSNSNATHSVKKTAYSVEEAVEFKTALEKLNDSSNVSYFLASDINTVLSNAVKHHNKSVEDGSYYKKFPEVKKEEDIDDINF